MMARKKYWLAVLNRDRNYDGRFVYAVRSTGIYCRPTCPSRRPNPSQVLFFSGSSLAEQAGFRPCRRCEPATSRPAQSELVSRICRYLEENSSESVNMAVLAEEFQVSSSHLQRIFKKTLGISISQYSKACRLASFKRAVRQGKDVTTALYEAGFGSSSRLYEDAESAFGMTPAEYRKGGGPVRIHYVIAACSLGRLLVAATKRGLCAVTLGDTDRELISALKREYPDASLARDRAYLQRAVKQLMAYLNAGTPPQQMPFDIRATAFQRRVWEELQRIPYGATRSYSEIAANIGKPGASRAVARACATNPLALVIPCHRVIGKTGKPGGYRWGKHRKEQLLKVERGKTR
ncbi:MAG TPA: bifunctional DNA-binding transcriptional regulator/O6-methylguanine-DNA methyltransferase Ada [Terriglobia bacterium]|nr:bifunctional DNA-binding transcriptional regulator/O6-methylguanine-DNA methyltransferase Ada [Terriglobia bacterium]